MLRFFRSVLLIAAFCQSAFGQQVTLLVLPFQTSNAPDIEIGKRAGLILDLQVWKTLRIPPEGPGQSSNGGILWDITSKAPASYTEANRLAKGMQPDEPQLVLWGRTWRYGTGNVVQAYLSIRNDISKDRVGKQIWRASPDGETAFAVDLPRWQVEFAPIVLRSDLLPELNDPAGLKLYANATGPAVLGSVGDYFRALEQNADTTKVVLPDGRQGWVRLPNLSRSPSEVVNFCGGVMRIFRQDWRGAQELFQRVLDNPHTPAAVRVDASLYLAIAADRTGGDSYSWIRKAYDVNPYSKTTVLYLCMSHLSALSRLQGAARQGPEARGRINALVDIVDRNRPLFSQTDPWVNKLQHYLVKSR